MNVARKIVVVLAGFVFITAVSITIYLLTLQATIMDRNVVKGWLVNSKIYDGKLISTLVNSTTKPAEVQQAEGQPANQINASPAALTNALSTTFNPEFVQTQTEKTIDNAYDYAEGKTTKFTFSIPIDQKRDTIIQQLSKEIQPQIAALPICTQELVQSQTPCRPPTESVEQLAQKLTTESIDKAKIFDKPLTNETVAQGSQQPSRNPLERFPAMFAAVKSLLTIMVPTIIISLLIVIFVSAADIRALAVSRLAKRLFFSTILVFILAIVLLFVARSNDLGIAGFLPGQIGDIIAPLIQQVIGGIASQLALISGIVCLVGLAGWIGLKQLQRQLYPAPVVSINPLEETSLPVVLDKTQPSDLHLK